MSKFLRRWSTAFTDSHQRTHNTLPVPQKFSVPELKEHSDNLSPLEHNVSSQNGEAPKIPRVQDGRGLHSWLGKPAALQGECWLSDTSVWAPQASRTTSSTRTCLTRGDTLTSTWWMKQKLWHWLTQTSCLLLISTAKSTWWNLPIPLLPFPKVSHYAWIIRTKSLILVHKGLYSLTLAFLSNLSSSFYYPCHNHQTYPRAFVCAFLWEREKLPRRLFLSFWQGWLILTLWVSSKSHLFRDHHW